ncbi:MAG: DNA helicase RecQ [Candidatus Aenigmarchaeota archaeon]|nr:DNA helicase RecQ [Candidatus Aenigmarchaeota archaeon]
MNDILKKHFGFSSLYPEQSAVINDVLAGKDVFVLMPTGSGKSLCYQLPALLKEGITVVVSPLIALMKDQVDSLRMNGISAAFINSSLSEREIEEEKLEILCGKKKILYVAPERLSSPEFISFLKMVKIGLFAVDEAHCISEWGHEFRPDYRNLRVLRDTFPSVPIIALTATAVEQVRDDIVRTLRLREPAVHKTSFNRDNLTYYIRPKENAFEQLVEYLNAHREESGIIYCLAKKETEQIASKLEKKGFKALPYHAGLSDFERENNQDLFKRDDAQIIVATIAFGMGIDKPNIRYVIHYDVPKSIEGYYQETGRAGRDRLPSDCILFFSRGDAWKLKSMMDKSIPSPKKRQLAYAKLDEMLEYCESSVCRRKFVLGYFGESFGGNCGKCDNCLTPKETMDATGISKKIFQCIYETGQSFGASYVASVLTAGKNVRPHHVMKKSFNSGAEYTQKQWISFIRELAAGGFIGVTNGDYPVLKLNEKSMSVLYGKEGVLLTKPGEARIASHEIVEPGLFGVLRALRKAMADAEGVPPYMIFPDRSLKEMASYYPQSLPSLKSVHGVGEAKLKRYGPAFLKKIREYCSERGIAERPSRGSVPTLAANYLETLELVNSGLSIGEIAAKRSLAEKEILFHVESLLILGKDVNIDGIIPKERQDAIRGALRSGAKPVAPAEEIRIVRLKK